MARNWYDSVVPADATPPPRDIDVSVAHPARVYDYWLGGKDNFAADRVAAEQVLEAKPGIRDNVRANRRFLARAVQFLTAKAGLRSSWTSAPASRRRTTRTRWPRPCGPKRGSSTWTTTRSCWPTPGPC